MNEDMDIRNEDLDIRNEDLDRNSSQSTKRALKRFQRGKLQISVNPTETPIE